MSGFNSKGFPSNLTMQNTDVVKAVKVEEGCGHISIPTTVTGNGTTVLIPAPTEGHLIIKGISIVVDGNSGTVKIMDSDLTTCYLPAYISRQNQQGTSSGLNITLDDGVGLTMVCDGRGNNDETFVGVSYMACNG